MTAHYILVVDDEPDIRQLVGEILEDEGYEVALAENAEQAKQIRDQRRPDLVLLDIWMPGEDGISLLKSWQKIGSLCCPVIMMSGHGTIETAVEATRLGAYDFIEKPLSIAKMLLTIENAIQSQKLIIENKGLKGQLNTLNRPIGQSDVIEELRENAKRIALHNKVVLIYGESGVGKDVVARYIHAQGRNANNQFVRATIIASNSLSDTKLDKINKQIFGWAADEKIHYGLLDESHGGTLYFPDVAELPIETQKSLLLAIQNNTFTRVHSDSQIELNTMLLFSSQHDLRDDVEAGSFDNDLYLEISTVPLVIPSLRDHTEDIPELLNYYVDHLTEHDGLPYRHFSVQAQNFLRNHQWLGNIHELRNLVQRLLILGTDTEITQDEIEEALGKDIPIFNQTVSQLPNKLFDLPLRQAREQFERDYLDFQLKQVNGNVSKLAKLVKMERTHLYRKMRSLDIDPKKYNN